MRYKTIIELTCEANDRDEATHTVGEYLRGSLDSGVSMKCRTVSLVAHRIARGTITSFLALVFCSVLFVKGVAVKDAKDQGQIIYSTETATVMPALKTKGQSEFQENWDKKKGEAIMDYLKK